MVKKRQSITSCLHKKNFCSLTGIILNKIEKILVRTIDKLAPITEFMDNVSSKSQVIPRAIVRKIGKRK